MAYCAQAGSVAVRGWGLLTGWGTGLQSLPTSVPVQGQRLSASHDPGSRQRTLTPGNA